MLLSFPLEGGRSGWGCHNSFKYLVNPVRPELVEEQLRASEQLVALAHDVLMQINLVAKAFNHFVIATIASR